MVKYEPGRDKIVVNGQVISPGRAKQMKAGLKESLEIRETYQSSPELHDCSVNERAIELLCGNDEGSEKIPVTIGFALEEGKGTSEDIAEEYVEQWENKWETHGEVVVWENNVEAFFRESSVTFVGFYVEFASDYVRQS